MEFPSRDQTPRQGRIFRGLHDTTDWHERAKEQIENWDLRETASLRALLHSAMQDREAAQREAEQLDRLAVTVRRAEETQADLAERETTLRAAADRATELQGQGSSVDQEELVRLRADLQAQQALARGLQEVMTAIGRSHSRSRSGASAIRATGASVGQYLAGSSSRRRNEEGERHRQGEASAQSGRGGGEMPPPTDRQEGSEESGGEAAGRPLAMELRRRLLGELGRGWVRRAQAVLWRRGDGWCVLCVERMRRLGKCAGSPCVAADAIAGGLTNSDFIGGRETPVLQFDIFFSIPEFSILVRGKEAAGRPLAMELRRRLLGELGRGWVRRAQAVLWRRGDGWCVLCVERMRRLGRCAGLPCVAADVAAGGRIGLGCVRSRPVRELAV
ncbi:hypothetical protein Taro_024152 [Colocasia esculenta]|uniref:Uncharacterized protein n=1 Tax=Colocasia esculenta TaxID=4460 RepID=A0A843UZJ4_COLES|nr:hypothetical protein [Colocasia esculenta]